MRALTATTNAYGDVHIFLAGTRYGMHGWAAIGQCAANGETLSLDASAGTYLTGAECRALVAYRSEVKASKHTPA